MSIRWQYATRAGQLARAVTETRSVENVDALLVTVGAARQVRFTFLLRYLNVTAEAELVHGLRVPDGLILPDLD